MDWHHAQLSDVQQHTHKVTFCSIFSTLPDKIQIWTRAIGFLKKAAIRDSRAALWGACECEDVQYPHVVCVQ